MSIHTNGINCDVCGKYILPIINLNINPFSIPGIKERLHCHDECKKTLIACGKEWTKLPHGPLRQCFETSLLNDSDKSELISDLYNDIADRNADLENANEIIERLVYVLEMAWSSKDVQAMSDQIEKVRDEAIKFLSPWEESKKTIYKL